MKTFRPVANQSIIGMGGTGGSGGAGGSGGKGGSGGADGSGGGNSARKRRRDLESPEETAARLRKRRKNDGTGFTVQAATHLLNQIIFGVDEDIEANMVEMKWELDTFFDAVQRPSVVAVDQGKVLSVQIQYAQPGLATINAECGVTKWRLKLTQFAEECALFQVCQIRLTNFDSVSVTDAHLLESYAQ